MLKQVLSIVKSAFYTKKEVDNKIDSVEPKIESAVAELADYVDDKYALKDDETYGGLNQLIEQVAEDEENYLTKADAGNTYLTNKYIAYTESANVRLNSSDNTASGGYAVAEGKGTTASGNYSHAEGYSTKATQQCAHAEGFVTTASGGSASHAEGVYSTASGNGSHAEGNRTTASGPYSHAEGNYAKATNSSAHAEGESTTASGNASHAEGFQTTASGGYSHVEGYYTIATGGNQHVQGKYNMEDSSSIYADIIGNGTSPSKHSNAATVDWSGNAWYAGNVYVGSTSGQNKDDGSKKLATEEYVDTKTSSIDLTNYATISYVDNHSITADTELNTESTNAVQNKVIAEKINEIEEKLNLFINVSQEGA